MRKMKYLTRLREFFITSQWKFLLITIVAVAFLFLRQTDYFDPYFRIPLLVFFFLIWLFAILLFKFKPYISFTIAIFFLLVALGLLLAGIKPWAERAALYAYGLFVIGVVEGIITEVFLNRT